MPNWKGKEYPYNAKGVAAYWAARGKDEKTPYKRKKVKAKSAQAKPKPSSVRPTKETAGEDLSFLSGGRDPLLAHYDSREALEPTRVTGMPEEPPPPKDKRTNWDKRKRKRTRPTQRSWSRGRAIPGTIGKDRFAKSAALWEKAEHDARAKDRRKTTKTGPVTTTTPTSKKKKISKKEEEARDKRHRETLEKIKLKGAFQHWDGRDSYLDYEGYDAADHRKRKLTDYPQRQGPQGRFPDTEIYPETHKPYKKPRKGPQGRFPDRETYGKRRYLEEKKKRWAAQRGN